MSSRSNRVAVIANHIDGGCLPLLCELFAAKPPRANLHPSFFWTLLVQAISVPQPQTGHTKANVKEGNEEQGAPAVPE